MTELPADLKRHIEEVPDVNDPAQINYWVDLPDGRKLYIEGWCNQCYAGTGFSESGSVQGKLDYASDLTPRTLKEKAKERGYKLIKGGFVETPDKDLIYGVTWGIYEHPVHGGAHPSNPMSKEVEPSVAMAKKYGIPVISKQEANAVVMREGVDIPAKLEYANKNAEAFKFMSGEEQRNAYGVAIRSKDFKGTFEVFEELFANDIFDVKTGKPIEIGGDVIPTKPIRPVTAKPIPKQLEPLVAFETREFKSLREFKNKGEFLDYIKPQLKEVPHPYVSGSKTVRPFVVGYGCDGSTDANIHYVAQKMTKLLGFDYAEIYNRAYPDQRGMGWITKNLAEMKDEALKKQNVKDTTIIPQNATIQDVLDDLYDINNRSLVEELENTFEKAKIPLNTKLKELKASQATHRGTHLSNPTSTKSPVQEAINEADKDFRWWEYYSRNEILRQLEEVSSGVVQRLKELDAMPITRREAEIIGESNLLFRRPIEGVSAGGHNIVFRVEVRGPDTTGVEGYFARRGFADDDTVPRPLTEKRLYDKILEETIRGKRDYGTKKETAKTSPKEKQAERISSARRKTSLEVNPAFHRGVHLGKNGL